MIKAIKRFVVTKILRSIRTSLSSTKSKPPQKISSSSSGIRLFLSAQSFNWYKRQLAVPISFVSYDFSNYLFEV